MRLLKAKALAALAVGTGWYAVGGLRGVARRILIAAIDAAVGKPEPGRAPPVQDTTWFNREPPAQRR